MIKAFQIYKEGTTNGWITILIPSEIFNDSILNKKIEFYKSLNYNIKSI